MQIQVTFRHVEPSEAVKEYAREKVSKIKKYLDGHIEANVTFTVQKHRHEADVTIIAGGLKIHGRETTGDLYSALDRVMDKLETQVKRYRDKLKNLSRGNKKKAKPRPFSVGIYEADSVPEPQPRIIKRHTLTAKPMDADEAAMQLDLSQDSFLVFINSRTDMLNVIYRRGDGNFGLIEPQ